MNVLHIVPSFYPALSYGGPVHAVYSLSRALARGGCRVRVLSTNANGRGVLRGVETRRDVQLDDGVLVRYCARQGRASASLPLLRWLRPYVRWADVVHLTATYSFPTIPTLLACRLIGRPVVWSPRGGLLRWAGSRRQVMKRAWESVCRVVRPRVLVLHATSSDEAAACARRLPGVECVVIPNGVDIPPEALSVRSNGVLRLLYLGRLDPIKGLENLLAACRLLDDPPVTPWALTIAGGGDPAYAEHLATLRVHLGLSRASFVGEVDRPGRRRALEAADILVLPSHSESFGSVVAEALAHGVPVIASRRTPWQRLEEVGCGLWVDNTPAALAAAIRRARTMPLREMGQRGRHWMEERFAWNVIAGEVLAVYRRLAATSTSESA